MSQFKPYMITEAQKNNLPIKNGQLIFTTDKKNIYLDQENERLPFAFSAKDSEELNLLQDYLGIKIENNEVVELADLKSVILKNNNIETKNFLIDQIITNTKPYGLSLTKVEQENSNNTITLNVDLLQPWEAGKTYKQNYFVVYNGSFYKCLTENSDEEFVASKWEWIENKNKDNAYFIFIWTPLMTYELGTIVVYQNTLYKCLIDHTADEVFEENKWQSLTGPTGAAATITTEKTDNGVKVVVNDIKGEQIFYLTNGTAATISSEKKDNGDVWLTISEGDSSYIQIIERALSAYDLAVKNGFKGSETEWLESLHGLNANIEMEELTELNGYSFTIEDIEGNIQTASTYSPRIDEETKNWLIGDKDTGIKAEGITPRIDEETNNWIIDDIDTGISAKGVIPIINEEKNWELDGVDTGIRAEGSVEINTDCAILYATFLADGWSNEIPYTQTVAVNNISINNVPIVDIFFSEDISLWEAEKNAYNYLTKVETIENGVVGYCFEAKPENDFTIKLKVAGDINGLTVVTQSEFDELKAQIDEYNVILEDILNGNNYLALNASLESTLNGVS